MVVRVLSYVLLGAFFGLERLLRRDEQARRVEPDRPSDRGSSLLIAIALSLATVVAPLLNRRRIGRVERRWVGAAGLAAMLAGLALRAWAMRTLGAFYTRTLLVASGQRIVARGPYRLVRHPGYLGTILVWVGAALAAANWLATATVGLLMLAAYGYRIGSEEAMLVESFGEEYRAYMARTWRLVPRLY